MNDVVRKLSQQYAYTSIRMHETIARKAGLSGTDHKYLGFLIQKGQMTAGELAALTGLTTGAVTGLIDRFEKKKLLKRQFAADDRRKVIIIPETQTIMALLEPLYKEFRGRSEQLIASFSGEELTIIETYFIKAIEIMNDTTNALSNPEVQQERDGK
jgi:DNA-binding MarR family transcriptional regulator